MPLPQTGESDLTIDEFVPNWRHLIYDDIPPEFCPNPDCTTMNIQTSIPERTRLKKGDDDNKFFCLGWPCPVAYLEKFINDEKKVQYKIVLTGAT